MTVHEDADGKLTIRHNGRVLLHRAHAKDEARITQGAIVENRKLGAALGWIAERQRKRDAENLTKPSISLRKKARIRAAADLAGQPPQSLRPERGSYGVGSAASSELSHISLWPSGARPHRVPL